MTSMRISQLSSDCTSLTSIRYATPIRVSASDFFPTPSASSIFPETRPPWLDRDDLPSPIVPSPASSTVFHRYSGSPKPVAQIVWDRRTVSPRPRCALGGLQGGYNLYLPISV